MTPVTKSHTFKPTPGMKKSPTLGLASQNRVHDNKAPLKEKRKQQHAKTKANKKPKTSEILQKSEGEIKDKNISSEGDRSKFQNKQRLKEDTTDNLQGIYIK